MLASANRLVHRDDYRRVVRRGVKVVGRYTIAYLVSGANVTAVRFGFITARNVGNAVIRNRTRRRLKAACREMLDELRPGTDVVVRALPNAATASWSSLEAELRRSFRRGGVIEPESSQ